MEQPHTPEPEQQEKKRRTIPYTQIELPGPINSAVNGVSDRWSGLRNYLIHTLPGFVVNHASNFVGGVQMVAEAMMFKANGVELMKGANRGNPLHYAAYPVRNIATTVFGKFNFGGGKFSFGTLAKPATYTEGVRNFLDLERATQQHIALGKPFVNNISALSSVVGMSSMALATIAPDRKETQEETEKMAAMAHNNPVKYVGHRFFQAVNPLCWWSDKRQAAGLGMVITGVCSFLGAFRQVGERPDKSKYFRRNPWHAAGSAIMTFAGFQLWLNINNQQGWTNYGTTQLFRLLTLPGAITDRFKMKSGGKEQGAGWYFGAQATMVLKNSIASLLGGAERLPDGTVVDHAKMRIEAKEKVREEDGLKQPDRPDSKIGQVMARETMAEPPRAVALQT